MWKKKKIRIPYTLVFSTFKSISTCIPKLYAFPALKLKKKKNPQKYEYLASEALRWDGYFKGKKNY